MTSAPLPPAAAGRAEFLRDAARARTGLTQAQRELATRRRHLHDAPRPGPRLGAGQAGPARHERDGHERDGQPDSVESGWIEVEPNPGGRPGEHRFGPGHSVGHSTGHCPATQPATYEWPDE